MTDGAQISIRDSRVSKALGWFWGVVGMGITGSILLAANNLYQLNVTVARGIDSDAARDALVADHEQRLRNVERDVSEMQGKVFRGIPGYQEKPRGN